MDRNVERTGMSADDVRSPSVRRAWIEMYPAKRCKSVNTVALREEGVDRNITGQGKVAQPRVVALREEGVDRS